jgi:hypothetical protein
MATKGSVVATAKPTTLAHPTCQNQSAKV